MARQAQKSEIEDEAIEAQRLDKWLWYARVAKTRTLAATLVSGGRVRINRVRTTKPAQVVKAGDVVTVSVAGGVRVLKILLGGTRRGPATEAATLYEEIVPLQTRTRQRPPDQAAGKAITEASPIVEAGQGGPVSEAGSGRPTKKDRRTLDRLRSINED